MSWVYTGISEQNITFTAFYEVDVSYNVLIEGNLAVPKHQILTINVYGDNMVNLILNSTNTPRIGPLVFSTTVEQLTELLEFLGLPTSWVRN